MPLADLSTLINATTQNLSQLKAFAAIYHLLQGGTPAIAGFTTLINSNNDTNFGSKTATNPGPVFNIENVFINVANALFQGNASAQTAFNNLAAGITLSDKLVSVYNALVDPSQQTDAGRAAFAAQSAFYAARAVELGIPGDAGGAVVGFGALLNILVRDNNVGIGNSVNDLVQAINDGSAALPESSTTFTAIETADGTKFDADDGGTAATITLTTGADTPGAAAPSANTLGISAAETYVGVFDPSGGATTLSNADTLDGAGGTDILNLRVASTSTGGSTIAPTSSNVENFFITNQSTTNPFTLDFTNIKDETQVWDKGSVSGANTKAINVDPSATVGMDGTLGFYEVHFSGDRSGTSDAFSLALKDAGTAKNLVNFSTITTSGAVDNTFEIINISSAGTLSNVSLGVDPMTLKTVNVTGDAALMLGEHDFFIGLSNVDASGMTGGGLNVNAKGSAESGFVFKGSGNNDRLVLKNTTINTASSLDGGAGKDTLASENFNSLQASAVNKATGFEVLEGISGVESISASSFTGISEFLFSGTTPNGSRATFSDVESTDRIALSTDVTSGSYAIRVEGKNAGTKATIELRAVNETNGETVLHGNNTSSSSEYGLEVRTNISTMVLDSTGAGTKANLIEVDKGSDSSNYAIGNSSTAVFDVTGSHDLTILAKAGVDVSDGQKIAGFSNAVSVDASGFTGILRIAGSNSDDVIKGGSANDIIYGMGGDDTLTGNGGSDQFRLAEFYNKTDTITDFAKGSDKVGLNEFDFTNTTATQAGATLASADYVENLNTVSNISGAEDKKLVELQTSLSNAQITGQTSTAAAEAYVLVHNTTTGKAEVWYDSNWNDTGSRQHIITFDNVIDLTGVTGFSNTDFVEYAY